MSTPPAPASSPATVAAAAPGAEQRKGLLARISARISVAWLFAFLITFILVVGEATKQGLGGYSRLPLALGSAIVVEVVLSRLFRGRWPHPLSAYITGNSVAILVKPLGLWLIPLASAVSIVSKYALTFRGRHLWNPSNFGIAILLLVAPGSMAILSHEWGNDWTTFAVVFVVGMLVAMKGKLLHLSGTYAVAFVAFAWLRSVLPGGDSFVTEVTALLGPVYLLFMFFMITDPRTIVRGKRNQALVVLIIAATDCAIRVLGNNDVAWIQPLLPAPPIFALAIVGPLALLAEQLLRSRPPKPAAVAPAAGAR